MSDKLKSRKLWAFIATFIVALANFVFSLGMPAQDVLYLVGLTASYILGQGYVDAKQQPVKELPVADITNSFAAIIQTELAKIPAVKDLPIADIMDAFKVLLSGELAKVNVGQTLSSDDLMTMFKSVLATEMAKINTFTIAPVVAPQPIAVVAPIVVPEVVPVASEAVIAPVDASLTTAPAV